MSGDEKKPYLAVYIPGNVRKYYNRKPAQTLMDMFTGPSRGLRRNHNVNAMIYPGRPSGKVLQELPHKIHKLNDDNFPDVYVSHEVPIDELLYFKSYDKLYDILENKYELTRIINDNGDIYYVDNKSVDS